MKKMICVAVLLFGSISMKLAAQELKSEFLFDLDLSLDAPQVVGPVLKGTRLIFPFISGTAKGDKINGKILGSGAEWGLVLDSTTFRLDVRSTLQTDDGALIYISYTGFNYAEAKKFSSILAGKGNELPVSDYYFRSAPIFETSSPKYAWLNHTVAIGVGRFTAPGKIAYRIYAIK